MFGAGCVRVWPVGSEFRYHRYMNAPDPEDRTTTELRDPDHDPSASLALEPQHVRRLTSLLLATSGESKPAVSPINGQPLGDVPQSSEADVVEAFKRARKAQARGGNVGNTVAAGGAGDASSAPMTPMTPPPADNNGMTAAPGAAVAPAPAAPGVDPNSLLGSQLDAERIQRERAQTQYRGALEASQEALNQNPPAHTAAIENARRALAVVDENARYFSESCLNSR